jgi:hypothetical protein
VSYRYAVLPLEGVPYWRLPEWPETAVRVLATPSLGAGFAEYLLEEGGCAYVSPSSDFRADARRRQVRSSPRHESDRAALVREVLEGGPDTVGSDHSPSPREMKQAEDFFSALRTPSDARCSAASRCSWTAACRGPLAAGS